MAQAKLRAVFMRGGTSRALFFREEDLPPERATRNRIFLAALGSPDPYGRQLDGLGGGSSSTSKIAIVGRSSRSGVDVDYTFAQVSVDRPQVDYRGNCGNISSAVGPYAIDEGLVANVGEPATRVVIFNTNTAKRIIARVPVEAGQAAVEGDFELAGVPGSGARIALEFEDPGGAVTGKLLPTGAPCDAIEVPGVGRVLASLVDATNPMVFVRAAALGLSGRESPAEVDARPDLTTLLEKIRAEAAVRMGIAPDVASATERSPAVPKIGVVSQPATYLDLSGNEVAADAVDVVALVISMGKAHRAIALTAAMCLAVAASVPGTVVAEVTRSLGPGQDVRIGHPSGVLPIGATVERGPNGYYAVQTRVYRTARRLMEGWIRVPERALVSTG